MLGAAGARSARLAAVFRRFAIFVVSLSALGVWACDGPASEAPVVLGGVGDAASGAPDATPDAGRARDQGADSGRPRDAGPPRDARVEDVGLADPDGPEPERDASRLVDAAMERPDAQPRDAEPRDAEPRDAGPEPRDAGPEPRDAGPEPDAAAEPLPEFPQLDTVVDLARGERAAWAHLIYVDESGPAPRFGHHGYGDTSERVDFWPASTIKIYTATAALVLLSEQGFSIDAEATFLRETNGRWVEDLRIPVREMIAQTFNCSSNETYTLLLRLGGIDWLNQRFFTPARGFERTALMRGYVTQDARPHAYRLGEAQRIVLREAGREWVREHAWSGRSYANEVGCVVYNGTGTGNCTSPRDLAEHLRRLIYHEDIPAAERFAIDEDALEWYRRGGPELVLNNDSPDCGGPGWQGVSRVFPQAEFFHKGGLVQEYRLDLHAVRDAEAAYILAVAIDHGVDWPIARLSEEIARMVRTPAHYVHLASLRDHVNPVRADTVVYSETGGTMELITKAFAADGFDARGWAPLGGTRVQVPAGTSAHALRSVCLEDSEQVHIRALLQAGEVRARSDLHYVIVDADVPCP